MPNGVVVLPAVLRHVRRTRADLTRRKVHALNLRGRFRNSLSRVLPNIRCHVSLQVAALAEEQMAVDPAPDLAPWHQEFVA